MQKFIPKGFPMQTTDEDLRTITFQAISDYSEKSVPRDVPLRVHDKEIYTLGYLELQIRTQKELGYRISDLKVEIESLRKSNRSSNKSNRLLTIVIIVLALITSFIGWKTLSMAKNDFDSDAVWRNEQLFELRRQYNQLESLNKNLRILPFRDSI
ncbi:hypothetical protein ACFLTI_08560 [Bacteroidota bacterium]